jgi:predicted HTH transcriptional regulator
MAAYSLATDWDINQVWAVILPFLQKYGKAKRSDIVKIIGPHLSEKQIRRYLDILKSNGLLKTEGQNRTTIYLLGDSYAANNELISKALAIGLQELKNKGEI